jgi:branched-chain amino acid transport system ATP-binding protein
MLELNNLEVVYDRVILVLRGLSLTVAEGSVVCVLGANGAGKSTTLKAISGLLGPERGSVTKGTINLDSRPIQRLEPETIVRRGVRQVLEGRRVFEHLSVEENLRIGGYARDVTRDSRQGSSRAVSTGQALARIYGYFPALEARRHQLAGYLSGGEQQMLAIGRALMTRPRLLLLDEPSLGLAPRIVSEIYEMLERIRREERVTMLLVEQTAARALSIADYGYVMENGRIVLEGPAEELSDNDDVKEFYLGLSSGGHRTSYRDVKRYRRRKRWLS